MIRRRSTEGFTLIEFLVILAFIGVLAGILLPAMRTDCGWSRVASTRSTIKALCLQVHFYQLDWGLYPLSTGEVFIQSTGDKRQVTEETALVIFLDGLVDNGGPATCYYEFKRSEIDAEDRLVDPWGHPYRYRLLDGSGQPGKDGTPPFRIWSMGGHPEEPSKWITSDGNR